MRRLLLAAALALPLAPTESPAQGFRLGEVLVVHLPDLRSGADTAAFERHLLERVAPEWNRASPDMQLHLLKAERGSRAGQHMVLWSGDAPFTPAMVDRVRGLRPGVAPFVAGDGRDLEYHLVAPETVGALPVVEILGIHYIQVRPERREEFERFVAERLHPAVGNLRPDLRLLYYRSVRGEDAGGYITIFALTNASRDRYWPGGADSDELRAAFSPAVRALAEELKPYLVEGTYGGDELVASAFESRELADFLHIPAPR